MTQLEKILREMEGEMNMTVQTFKQEATELCHKIEEVSFKEYKDKVNNFFRKLEFAVLTGQMDGEEAAKIVRSMNNYAEKKILEKERKFMLDEKELQKMVKENSIAQNEQLLQQFEKACSIVEKELYHGESATAMDKYCTEALLKKDSKKLLEEIKAEAANTMRPVDFTQVEKFINKIMKGEM